MEGWVSEVMKTVFVFAVRTVMLMVFFSVTTLFMPCDTPTAIVFVEIGCESVIMRSKLQTHTLGHLTAF